jgi:phage baseplate assembly protein V
MDIATLSRMVENLLRVGKIEELDLAAKCCRVRSGKLLTNWLPWVTPRAGTTRTWDPPTVGEQVLLLSPSGELGAGIVLTGLFSAAHEAPSSSADEHLTVYPDGARISYNHATGALEASGIQTALVQAASLVTIDCPATHLTGALTVDGLLTYKGGMTGSGGGAGVDAVIQGNVVISGIPFVEHTHPDAQGGTTGGAQQ